MDASSSPLVTYTSGYLILHIYLHETDGRRYYDVVLYRRVKRSGTDRSEYLRGPNLKPTDVPHAIILYQAAEKYLQGVA